MSNFLKEYRCKNCNKLFFKGDLTHCTIEVKCKNCKQFSTIEGGNCKLFLMLKDEKKNENEDLTVLKNLDIKDAILQCSECDKSDDCGCHNHLKDNVCPLCNRSVDKQ